MDVLNDIYAAIAAEGFTAETLQMIDNYAKDIHNGREDFFRFNLSEHAGLCKGGSPLIGASIIACYATASLRASCNAEGREGQCQSREDVSSLNLCRDEACARSTEQGSPANWEIDEQQEKFIVQWAKAANLCTQRDGSFCVLKKCLTLCECIIRLSFPDFYDNKT